MAKKKKKGGMITKLKGMQKSWADSEPKRGGVGVPDDDYVARIDTAVLGESKTSQRLQIEWGMTVLEGDFEGKKISKYDGINEAKDLPYVQGTLEALELDIPEDITEIGEVLENAVGLIVDVTVKTRDEFTNIYFNELVEDYEESEEEEGEEEEEESDFDALTEDSDEADFEACSEEIGEILSNAGLDADDYGSWKEAWEAIPEDGEEEEEAEEEEEEEEGGLTEDDINDMSLGKLKKLIKDDELDVNIKLKKNQKVAGLRKSVIAVLFE